MNARVGNLAFPATQVSSGGQLPTKKNQSINQILYLYMDADRQLSAGGYPGWQAVLRIRTTFDRIRLKGPDPDPAP